MSTVLQRDVASPSPDFLSFHGADFIEFYVGNAQQAAYYYRMAMGMTLVGYAGPETGRNDRTSFVLQQGDVRFVLTTSLRPGTEIAEYIHRHGDGVRDIALEVDDARQVWRETTKRGARSVREPFELHDEHGAVRMASIAAYGETVHTFVERYNYHGAFLPGYAAVPHDPLARSTGLAQVDHVGGTVGWREMNRWVNFYSQVMGFSARPSREQHGGSASSVLMSKPQPAGKGRLRFSLEQPRETILEGRATSPRWDAKSSVAEYLEFNHGPGIEYIALSTTDILYTVSRMQEQGVDFVPADPSCAIKMGRSPAWLREQVSELQRLGIQIGYDEEEPMLEISTRPVDDRPTLFFKIVQRQGFR